MSCERVRRSLSIHPPDGRPAHSLAVCCHLRACPSCRRFAEALSAVDQALTVWPMANPPLGLLAEVVCAARRHPKQFQVASPFSRAFWMISVIITLCALVGGAIVLHYASAWSYAGPQGQAGLLVTPSWPTDASTWLSLQAELAAQTILAVLTGLLVAAAGAALGFRANARGARHSPPADDQPPSGRLRLP